MEVAERKVEAMAKTSQEKKVKIVQDPDSKEPPIERPVLAAHIIEISRAFAALTAAGGGRLSKEVVVVLVAHRAKLGIGVVRDVIDCIEDLDRWACRR